MEAWLEGHDYMGVEQARGSLSFASIPDPEVLERTSYMKTLTSYVPTW
jgi:hypothetical protein